MNTIEQKKIQLMIDQGMEKKSPWYTAPLKYPFGRGMHLQIEVKNVRKVLQRIKKKNDIPSSKILKIIGSEKRITSWE